MSTNTVGLFLRHLALSAEVGRLGTASDRDLLAAYESERGQAAFTELMRRHGPMVLRTCRRVLGRGPDAEDAFQATFVLLARRAGHLERETAGPLSLGGWLHRVAYRTAVNVLAGATRRKVREQQAAAMTQPDPDPVAEATWNEVRPILDTELDALPEESRRLLIACYLQDKTHAEAAAELGMALGSLARRLEKARALLAERLVRRGIAISAPLLVLLLEESAKGAGVPAVLLVHTVEAARTFTEQMVGMLSENVARLVKGGLAQMAKGSTHLSMVLAGWLGLLGAGLLACQTLKAWPDRPPEGEPAATAERSRQGEREPTRTDRHGDPLPHGALARLGTVRWRHVNGVQSLAFTPDGKGLIAAGKGDPARLWDVATGRMVRQFGGRRDGRVYYLAALSPDGRTVAGSVESAGDLGLWDVTTGTLLHRLKGGRPGHSARLAFSPNGKTVALGEGDGQTLRLWETAAGEEMWVAKRLQVASLIYSADSKTLIWSGHRGDLHLWDVAAGKELRRWDDDKKRSISALACSPDGRLFAAYGPRGEAGSFARLWDANTDKETWQRATEEGAITTAAFSPDGKVLATGCLRGPLCLWDAATGKELRRYGGRPGAQSLAFSPDGKTLASGSGGAFPSFGDQTIHLWDVDSGREVRRTDDGHQATICSATFTPDGQNIVSSSWEGSLRVWDAATGKQRRQVQPAGDEHFVGGWIASIASVVSPDGKTLVAAHWDLQNPNEWKSSLKVRRWNRDTGRELPGRSREIEKLPHSLVISPDGKTVAYTFLSATPDQVHLWETATGKELPPIAGGYPAFSPDGKLVAAVSWGKNDKAGSFALWEAATAKELCSVRVPEGRVYRLLFSPDGRMLATASKGAGNQSDTIHLWPLLRDEPRKSAVRVGPPRALAAKVPLLLDGGTTPYWFGGWAFSPDGRTLAISGEGGTVRLLETASGQERERFIGHKGDVGVLAFAPDGRRLASGSRDTTLLVWDVTGGRLQGEHQPGARLSAQELETCWADLAANDPGRARRAIWTLVSAPTQAVPYLGERLRNSAADNKAQMAKVPQLLRDLDDDVFAVREKAKAELIRRGDAAEPALRRALEQSPSLETRRSLEQLLKALEAKHHALSGEPLRGVRALEALEQIGTDEARATLKTLTAGTRAEASLTQEACAALERLGRGERR